MSFDFNELKKALLDPESFRSYGYYSIDDNIFGLTKEQKKLREFVFNFAQKNLKLVAEKEKKDVNTADTDEQKDKEAVKGEKKDVQILDTSDEQKDKGATQIDNDLIYKDFGKLGLLGIRIEEKYGGSGGCYLDRVIVQEELSRANSIIAMNYSMYTNHCIYPIYCFGSEEQKLKYLPKLCRGELIASQLISNSVTGPTVLRAKKHGDYYILNGIGKTSEVKFDIFLVYATTNFKTSSGVTAFIVEKNLIEKYLSIDTSLSSVKFYDCKVPVNMLGEKNKGKYYILSWQNLDDMIYAGGLVGLMQAFSDIVFKYMYTKNEFIEVKDKIADMYAKLGASRNYLYTVARAYDDDYYNHKDCAALMLYCINNVKKLALETERMLGESSSINKVIKRLIHEMNMYELGSSKGSRNVEREKVSMLIEFEYSKIP